MLFHGELLEYIQFFRFRKLIMCPSSDGADNNLTDQTEQFDAAARQAAPPGGVTIEKKCLPVAGGDGTLIMCHQRTCTVSPSGEQSCTPWEPIPGTEGCAECSG